MKRVLTCLLVMCLTATAHAFSWHDLWVTPNQQAAALMTKGRYSEAEKRFNKKDWQATAAYRAGHYEEAAKLFQGLADDMGYYNQGNALAHMGRYEQAIDAYNKALAINPSQPDALQNKKILEELLKKDKQKQEQSAQNQNKPQSESQDKDKQDQNKPSQSNQDKQNQSSDKQKQENDGQQKPEGQNQDKNQQNKPGDTDQSDSQPDKHDPSDREKSQQQTAPSAQNKGNKEKTEQAAEANQNKEQEQAKERWLKLIPDDPGGLLRQKFLRDHLRRQSEW